MLEGMRACGVAEEAVIAESGLDRAALDRPDGAFPPASFAALWRAGFAIAGRETFALEVGLAVPYGAFGAIDYLAGTSDTVASAFESLASYLRAVAPGIRLEIDQGSSVVAVRLLNMPVQGVSLPPDALFVSDVFTLGVFLTRFRVRTEGGFEATLDVAGPPPRAPEAFCRVAATAIHFDQRTSALILPHAVWKRRLAGADPRLHETLRALSSSLDLGDTTGELERAIRLRLRSALAQGDVDATSMARALGLSERTLQRRLGAEGRTFQAIVDDFRHDEALALLRDPKLALAEIAARLGFSEQSSFNRAFKRWTGKAPRALRGASPRTSSG